MANFIILCDPDPQRRSRFIKTIEPLLPPVEGLVINSCATGDLHAIWAANPQAPISCSVDDEGAAIIWGEAIPPDNATRLDAKKLRSLWQNPQLNAPIFDGFYAAVSYQSNIGLAMGADVVGLYPVYYYTDGIVALVASSPELFKYHPRFKREFNPAGLVGILLSNGLVEGETLWKNVKRLEPGRIFFWKPGSSPYEIKQYQVSDHPSHQQKSWASLPFSEQVNILGNSLEHAIARHAPRNIKQSLLLSGGLDSRTLVGFLHRQGIETVALTLGRESDFEAQAASKIAKVLGLEHQLTDFPMELYPDYIERLIKWEHLSNGCNRFMYWGLNPTLERISPRFMAGFSMEIMLGGKGSYTISPDETLSFEKLFVAGVNNWGISPDILRKLLRKEVFGDLVSETIERMKGVYTRYSEVEFKRSLCFDLYHRQRYYVGGSAWQMCFGAWPVLPYLEQQLLECADAMPTETIANRRAQKAMLCTRFPELAKMPLIDNIAFRDIPLGENQRDIISQSRSLCLQTWRKLENLLGNERRYVCRIYDLNNSGWTAIRHKAEAHRSLGKDFFDPDVFNQLILPPDARMPNGNSPIKTSGAKALLGFLLWANNNL